MVFNASLVIHELASQGAQRLRAGLRGIQSRLVHLLSSTSAVAGFHLALDAGQASSGCGAAVLGPFDLGKCGLICSDPPVEAIALPWIDGRDQSPPAIRTRSATSGHSISANIEPGTDSRHYTAIEAKRQ